MDEYIERESLLSIVKPDVPSDENKAITISTAKTLIRSLAYRVPAADVAPVRHGKNLDAEWPSLFTCSACGWSDGDTTTGDTISYNYCPNCGAKMDLKEG